MSGPAMLDANILIYADDSTAGAKTRMAREVIAALVAQARAAVSPQVLGEYWTVATRRLTRPIPQEAAEARLRGFMNSMRVLSYDWAVVAEAVRGTRRYGFHYYDAQVWASARLAGIGIVLSEDFATGSEVEGVRFVDPFAEDFDLEALLGA
jgi:predicted nucleic acid-binding protein